MKNLNYKTGLLGAVIFALFTFNSSAQPWVRGTNLLPVGAPTFGTGAGTLQPITFFTNGVSRMFMADGGTGFANGFIGIGNGFVAPQNRLHLHQGVSSPSSPFFHVYTQWTNAVIGAGAGDGFLVGINTAGNAELRQQENRPIDVFTNNIQRIVINENRTGTISGVPLVNTFGFMGIGRFGPGSILSAEGPRTLLHLEGSSNTPFFNGGWRKWMRDGMYITQNSDALYIGMKDEGSNRSDAVINWSDDGTGSAGIDKLRFIFTHFADGNGNGGTNPLHGQHLNGYEFMRMVSMGLPVAPVIFNSAGFPIGHIGIGPLFTNLLPPQSRLHINAEDALATWLQISSTGGTGQLATDGTRLGIVDDGTAHLYNQENRNLLFSTNTPVPAAGFPTATNERMRITAIGTPNTSNPFGLPNNITRVSISQNPAQPFNQPISLLNLGFNPPQAPTGGQRAWMDVGTFTCFDSDNMYVGMKNEGTDRKDAIVNWGDNQGTAAGPDNLRFIFTSPGLASPPVNPLTGTSLNGYEFMRMAPIPAITNSAGFPVGHVGIGPLFTNALPPRSRLHINAENALPTYMQITSQAATGQTATDGMKVGIDNVGNAQVINQETNLPIQFWLNAVAPFTFVPTTNERMRITSQPYQVSLFAPNASLSTMDITRVGIWHHGNTPALNPVTMLQIGEPIQPVNANGIGPGGLRDWMNVGTYYNESLFDNMYVGLRAYVNAAGNPIDRSDAIINWGNNPANNPGPNPIGDRLRFIFTSANVVANGQSATYEGLEVARMSMSIPTGNNNISRMGIGGDATINVYSNTALPDAQNTLEINSPAPVYVPPVVVNNSTGFSTANGNTPANPPVNTPPTGFSGLRFTDLTSGSVPELNPSANLLTVNSNGDVILVPGGTFGALCTSPTPFNLAGNTAVGLNGFNFHFNDGPGAGPNSVGIGMQCFTPTAKLQIRNSTQPTGIQVNTSFSATNVYGIQTFASGGTNNYGIYASGTQYAGYFNGPLFENGNQVFGTSDSTLKENVDDIINALSTIRQLKPHTFDFKTNDFPYMNLPSGKQFGLISQELETIVPELVIDAVHPETLDSANNVIAPSMTIKGLNYIGLIPISISAIKQLDSALTKATSVPDAPVLISPADGAVGDFRKATFTWHSVSPGIVFYSAQAATDIAFTNIVRDQRGITDTATSFDLLCDTLPVTYYWRVNATNNAGVGPFSQVFSFTDTATCSKTPGPSPDPIRALEAVSFNSTSDSNFKTNIAPVTGALDKVSQLNGVYYDWVHTNPKYEFDSAQQIGFIAQDVQQVIPQVVRTDSNGYLTLDYGRMVPVLVEAIKELKAWKDSVSNNSMRTTNNAVPSTEEELASPNAILYQNIPNPFGDGTSIGYFVAENTTDAYLVFYDEFGNEIKKAELPYRGQNAKLNLTTQNLASGIYTYSLVVNGKIEDTKKMMKTK